MGVIRKKSKSITHHEFTLLMGKWFADDDKLKKRALELWRYGGQKCYAITYLLSIAMDYGSQHKRMLGLLVDLDTINDRAIAVAKTFFQANIELPECVNL